MITKPIVLDETGQDIKKALESIDDTNSKAFLVTYSDIDSNIDTYLASIAQSLSDIKEILENQ